MELKYKIENQTDDEILAELNRLSAEITRRKKGPRKLKEQTDDIEPIEKPKKTRHVEWRNTEDGVYNGKPSDPDYDKVFWKTHYKKPFTCDICGKTLTCCGSAIQKHQQSMRCQISKLKKEREIN